ncbi:hypothetical protein OE699_12820 [Sedimentimonas flavescens]|uniref:Uncharacterized protein n=1 Tax=Sedimentimonas flavescens TaxID=2851012 RepID=A0ABT3A1B5_9RHOB|nr:hypothetical protein [Sedimentimonas flavescens]MCV2879730.1 hypothetical protein [Sedimentimonas flavescens]
MIEEVGRLLGEITADAPRTAFEIEFDDLAVNLPTLGGDRICYLSLRRAGFRPAPDTEGLIWTLEPSGGWDHRVVIDLTDGDYDEQLSLASSMIWGAA